MRRAAGKILFLLALTTLIFGCTTAASYERTTDKPVDVYYGEPERAYETIGPVSSSFRERGVYTGQGSDEFMLDRLKDDAAMRGADAVINVEIETTAPAGTNVNWFARGTAVKYKTEG